MIRGREFPWYHLNSPKTHIFSLSGTAELFLRDNGRTRPAPTAAKRVQPAAPECNSRPPGIGFHPPPTLCSPAAIRY